MTCTIYISKMSHASESHELLNLALSDYLSAQNRAEQTDIQSIEPDLSDSGTTDRTAADSGLTDRLTTTGKTADNAAADLSQTDLTLDKADGGKPYLPEYPEIHFSISHSGDYWACAFAPVEIGLDLQEVTGVNGDRIAKRFLHPEEYEWLSHVGFDRFCLIWAHKESYLKYTGEGLVGGLDSFSLTEILDIISENKDREGTAIIKENPVWQKEIPAIQGYHMVCTAASAMDVAVRILR